MRHVAPFAALVAAVSIAAAAAPALLGAQVTARRRPAAGGGGGGNSGPVPITVALSVGGKSYRASGGGRCGHEPRASIYGTPAGMWMVQLASGNGASAGSTSMTMWRPSRGDGAAQLSLAVNQGSASHRISTVKGGETVGSGTVRFTPSGAGGRFDIDGKSGDGKAIRGTITCARLTGISAEGG